MSYNALEISDYSAEPIELYTFTCATRVWRYTSADEDKTVASLVYTAVPLKRSAFEENQDIYRAPITLTMGSRVEFLELYKKSPPTDIVQLTIQRYHEGDGELTTPWMGRVTNAKFLETTAEIRCEPIFTSLKRPILRRRYQTTCPHVLYDAHTCRVLAADKSVAATVSSVSGITISGAAIASKPTGYFSGGYVDYETGGVLERRGIIDHVGGDIMVNIPFSGLTAGATITLYPGCDHLLQTCNDKFGNVENYGGQPFFPDKNPFNGTTIF